MSRAFPTTAPKITSSDRSKIIKQQAIYNNIRDNIQNNVCQKKANKFGSINYCLSTSKVTDPKEPNKNFNFLLTASAFSNLADGIAGFAYPWLFSLITRDPLLISLTVLLATLPQLIFVLFAGVIADKFNRKSILIFTRILQVLLTLSFILLIYFNLDSIPKSVPIVEPEFNRKFLLITVFYIGAFIFGMLEVTRDNAAQSFLPQVVSKDELPK